MACLAWLGLGPGTLAARELNDFKPPQEMTPEELEASKARGRVPVNPYSKGVTDQVAPVPWKSISLFVLVIALIAPFALRYYRATAGQAEKAPARRSPSPAPSGRGRAQAQDATRIRNVGTVEGDTRIGVRRNTRP